MFKIGRHYILVPWKILSEKEQMTVWNESSSSKKPTFIQLPLTDVCQAQVSQKQMDKLFMTFVVDTMQPFSVCHLLWDWRIWSNTVYIAFSVCVAGIWTDNDCHVAGLKNNDIDNVHQWILLVLVIFCVFIAQCTNADFIRLLLIFLQNKENEDKKGLCLLIENVFC